MNHTIKLSDQDIKNIQAIVDMRNDSIAKNQEARDRVRQDIRDGKFYVSGEISRWSQAQVNIRLFYAIADINENLDSDNVLDHLDNGKVIFWDGTYNIKTNWVHLSDAENDDNSAFLDTIAEFIEDREIEIDVH